MAINIAPKSLDTELSELMRDVASGKAQLPETKLEEIEAGESKVKENRGQ